MAGSATLSGGHSHGLAPLSHSEFLAAQKSLDKLKSSSSLASKFTGGTHSATISGGSPLAGTPTLVHGQGSDTFAGGVKSSLARAITGVGNDTVVSGSKHVQPHTAQAPHALTADTVNISGLTAAGIKALDPNAAKHVHTIALGEKTKVNIVGLTSNDISKLHH